MKWSLLSLLVLTGLLSSVPAQAAVPAGPVQSRDSAPARQTASALAIAASAFSPATLTTSCSGSIANSVLDNTSYYPGVLHGVTYTAAGRTAGICQTASWSGIGFDYFPSVFSSTTAADQSFQDGSTYFPKKYPQSVTSAGCPTSIDVPCAQLSIKWSDGSFSTDYEIRVNQCLLEMRDNIPATQTSLNSSSQQILLQMEQAAVSTAKGACTPPVDYSIVAARVEPDSSTLDINATPLTAFQSGTPVTLAAYLDFNAGSTNCNATVTFTVLSGDVGVYSGQSHSDTCATPPARLVYSQRHVTIKAPGSYSLQVQAVLGSVSKVATTAFTVTNSPTATPTPATEPTSVIGPDSPLQLPVSAFSPAVVTAAFVHSNTSFDDPSYFPRTHHSVDFATLGRQTGYAQNSRWMPPGAGSAITVSYAGSLFNNAGNAARAYQDAATFYRKYSNVSVGTCPSGIDVPCTRLVESPVASNGQYRAWDDVFAYGTCLVETTGFGLDAVFAAQQNQLSSTLGTVDRAALAAIKSACPSLPAATATATHVPIPTKTPKKKPAFSFTFNKLRVLDVHGASRATFRRGEPFLLDMSWRVKHLQSNEKSQLTFRYQEKLGGRWSTVQTIRERILAANGLNPYQKESQFALAGQFRIIVDVTIKSRTQSRSVGVRITK